MKASKSVLVRLADESGDGVGSPAKPKLKGVVVLIGVVGSTNAGISLTFTSSTLAATGLATSAASGLPSSSSDSESSLSDGTY